MAAKIAPQLGPLLAVLCSRMQPTPTGGTRSALTITFLRPSCYTSTSSTYSSTYFTSSAAVAINCAFLSTTCGRIMLTRLFQNRHEMPAERILKNKCHQMKTTIPHALTLLLFSTLVQLQMHRWMYHRLHTYTEIWLFICSHIKPAPAEELCGHRFFTVSLPDRSLCVAAGSETTTFISFSFFESFQSTQIIQILFSRHFVASPIFLAKRYVLWICV